MEPTKGLTGCPACAAPGPGSPPVPIDLFGGAPLRRCTRCGSRRLAEDDPAQAPAALPDDVAGLPRLEGRELVEPMAEGPLSGSLPEPGLAEASESEVRRALADSWHFVSGPRSTEYLDRLVRSTARTIEGAPEDCHVSLFDEPAVRCLGLPSGQLLMSVAALGTIEDEAELVFVLGHELAHIASGDTARRLVALGLAELTQVEGGRDEVAWLRAVHDILGLGFGPENEHRADLQGVRAVLALGYDPESVIHYLERLGRAVDEDEQPVAEITLAHPLPTDRLHRVRKSWGVHLRDAGASRVNRDAYRRAVGHSALVSDLQAGAPFGETETDGASSRPRPWRDWRLVGTGVAILLLASLFLVLGLMLAR